jgi:hypothetical protein
LFEFKIFISNKAGHNSAFELIGGDLFELLARPTVLFQWDVIDAKFISS